MPGKHYNQLTRESVSAPLLSWDIFMDGYWRKIGLINDKQELNGIAGKNNWQQKFDLDTMLLRNGKVIIVTDPFLQIVFASSNMSAMNGYTAPEVLNKSPKIFQGKESDVNTITEIRRAVNEKKQFHASLINYKKNGNLYHCDIEGYPVFNKAGELVNFIAFEEST